MARIVAVGLFALLAPSAAIKTRVTPVEKVIQLLKGIQTQVEEDGKTEATNYDKFACFCKESVSDRLYAIETSEAKIAELDAKITELTGEINTLNGEISDLGTKIQSLADEIADATAVRKGEHDVFVVELKNVTDALSAIDRAIEAMKSSKAAMGGKVNLEAALAQVTAVTGKAFKQPGVAYSSEYHSNDIIATLEDLEKTFIKAKNDLELEEFEANSAYEKRKLGLTNEKIFAEKEKAEKEALVAKKTEAKEKAEADMTQETKEKEMDENFMRVLTADCEKKAAHWDQRSKTRADELNAISEAMTALETGVAPNYGANKKLVDLQQNASHPKIAAHWQWVEDAPAKQPTSFLQLRGSRRSAATVMQQALEVLSNAASETGSPVLSAAVLKIKMSEDHFVKVRGLIKDMIARLESDAASEATTKGFCDENMKTQVTSRDSQKSTLEDLQSQISAAEAEQAKLESEIAALSKAVAENIKALNEATQLRAEEKAANEKTLSEAKAGKEAVDFALTTLNAFYEGAAPGFLQYEPFVSTDAGRDGKTVADLAPKVFDEDYSGKQQESKGVIGLLEVIASDFERTDTTVTEQETEAQADFEEFESDTNADTAAKNADIKDKNGQVIELTDDLVTLADEKKDAANALELAEEELLKLKKMCVDGEETYEERVAKREKEIEALKEALKILDNWQA